MKKTLLLLAMVCIAIYSHSTILVVDNNSGAPAQYTNANTAISAAKTGDTIYLQPSGKTYGDMNINKRLILIGGGAYPIKQNNTPTYTGKISLEKGSNGSIFWGLYVDGGIHAQVDSLKNILIANCYLKLGGINTGDGFSSWIIEGCAFHQYGNALSVRSGNNLIVQNCIFGCGTGGGNSGNITFVSQNISNVLLKNNIFSSVGNTNPINPWYTISAITFENNIFYATSFDFNMLQGCQWYNNCFYMTSSWIGNTGSNSGNFQANPQFVNYPASGDYFSFSYDYHLASGSPCIGTGTNGTDIGVYGGAKRYNPGFQPPIPQILQINLKNNTVPVGGTLKLDVIIEQPK